MLRILHVDRSELFRKIMKEMVLRCGYSIQSVASIQEAVAEANTGIDLIITALELEGGGAKALLAALSTSVAAEVPVIVVSSTDSLEQRETLFSLGVVDYMLKNELSEDRLRRYFAAFAAEDELSRFMRRLRVAVVDDSQVILKIVARILSMNGFESVQYFSDPLELFKSNDTFDLYLVDIVLPNMSGEQVVSRLRSEVNDAIIISMSRFTGEKPLANVLLAGADDYIHKPFDAAALISRFKVNARFYQLKNRLEKMAVTDGLTGLYNHKYCYKRLEEETSKSCRYARPLSIAMLDVDNFKAVNDNRGHTAGDEVLRAIGKTLKGMLRSVDVVGRYGGEEFFILFPETPLSAARVATEKVRIAINNLILDGGSLVVSVSCGVTEHECDESVEAFISRADALLYKAKGAGKNRVEG